MAEQGHAGRGASHLGLEIAVGGLHKGEYTVGSGTQIGLEIAVGSAVEHVRQMEYARQRFSQIIRKHKQELRIGEEQAFQTITPEKLNGKIAGIDGGLLTKNLLGLDLVLGKAVGVIFTYKNNSLLECDYYPSPIPTPTPIILSDPMDSRDAELSASFERQMLELGTAIKTAELHKPILLLMHGSIIPHGSDKPSGDSQVAERYKRLIGTYEKLYETCTKNGVPLAGIVEDSRGDRFCQLLHETLKKTNPNLVDAEVLEKTHDTNLLYYLLDCRERTASFPFSKNPKAHPILRDMKKWGEKVHTTYMKTAPYDRPIRIDFLNEGNTEWMANTVYPLCQPNEVYGMPAVIIEADARARLSGNEMEMLHNQFIDRIGELPAIMRLRRELRPF